MAMIKCPECGRDISDKAKDCIHCGFPVKQAADCSNRNQNQQVVNHNKPVKKIQLVSGVVAMIILVVLFFSFYDNGTNRLDGEYYVSLPIADNLINFSKNGGFARFSRAFDDWELVCGGKYSLKGNSLILNSTEGKTFVFFYDKASDTMWQLGYENYIYRKSIIP